MSCFAKLMVWHSERANELKERCAGPVWLAITAKVSALVGIVCQMLLLIQSRDATVEIVLACNNVRSLLIPLWETMGFEVGALDTAMTSIVQGKADLENTRQTLAHFGEESDELRTIMAALGDWQEKTINEIDSMFRFDGPLGPDKTLLSESVLSCLPWLDALVACRTFAALWATLEHLTSFSERVNAAASGWKTMYQQLQSGDSLFTELSVYAPLLLQDEIQIFGKTSGGDTAFDTTFDIRRKWIRETSEVLQSFLHLQRVYVGGSGIRNMLQMIVLWTSPAAATSMAQASIAIDRVIAQPSASM